MTWDRTNAKYALKIQHLTNRVVLVNVIILDSSPTTKICVDYVMNHARPVQIHYPVQLVNQDSKKAIQSVYSAKLINISQETNAPTVANTVLSVIPGLISVLFAKIPSVSITVGALAQKRPIFPKISV